uniref:Uncharacterized protein n=1 Tax=Cacopsylla melanoneura TaxID=428564 RepID=A0A8D8ZFA8_9HEMI
MVYMKYLAWFSFFKIVVEFLFVVMSMWQIIELSEQMNGCNETIRRAVYQSQWYKCSPKVKQYVCMMLRETQQPNYLSFLNGFFILTNDFMLKVFKAALSFINFLKINGRL